MAQVVQHLQRTDTPYLYIRPTSQGAEFSSNHQTPICIRTANGVWETSGANRLTLSDYFIIRNYFISITSVFEMVKLLVECSNKICVAPQSKESIGRE